MRREFESTTLIGRAGGIGFTLYDVPQVGELWPLAGRVAVGEDTGSPETTEVLQPADITEALGTIMMQQQGTEIQ